jgi:hypothetical protein
MEKWRLPLITSPPNQMLTIRPNAFVFARDTFRRPGKNILRDIQERLLADCHATKQSNLEMSIKN